MHGSSFRPHFSSVVHFSTAIFAAAPRRRDLDLVVLGSGCLVGLRVVVVRLLWGRRTVPTVVSTALATNGSVAVVAIVLVRWLFLFLNSLARQPPGRNG